MSEFVRRFMGGRCGAGHRRVCGHAGGNISSGGGTIRLIGSNANNVFSNTASSITIEVAACSSHCGLRAQRGVFIYDAIYLV